MKEQLFRQMLRKRRRGLVYRDQGGERVFRHGTHSAESRVHLEIRTALYDSITVAFSKHAAIGSKQSVFWDPTNPDRVVVPDLFARIGEENFMFDSWKTWEWGAPHVVAMIADEQGATELEWAQTLRDFDAMGVEEVVRFDPISPSDPLRIWDRVRGVLLERELDHPRHTYSPTFDAHWMVVRMQGLGRVLRLARNPEGPDLYPTRLEYEMARRSMLESELERLKEDNQRERADDSQTDSDEPHR